MSESSKVPKSYGLLLFPGFEVLDAAGPIEALNVLSFFFNHDEIKLSVIAQTMDPVNPGPIAPATNGINFNGQQKYLPTHTFETAPELDVLIVPGGRGTERPNEDNEALINFIKSTYHGSNGKHPLKYIFSICTGSGLFAKAGILDGQKATTNKKAWKMIAAHGPKTHWIAQARWVSGGNIWTTSGVTASLDGMLALIGQIYGEKKADEVADMIEHTRIKEADNDPFSEVNGCQDVEPVK